MSVTEQARSSSAAGAPTLEDFEADARAFLDANAEKRPEETFVWGQGSDDVSLFPEKTHEQEVADLAVSRAWAQTVFDAGFGWITGPTEYGGRGLSSDHQRIWARVAADYRTPSMSIYGIGLGMVAPTILAHATDEVKEAYLRRMWRGDIVGCQLFSEPSSGSDLASLQTRAVKDGDEWVLNGQKVWTSGAQVSDIGEIICRTDPDLPKHRGLTGFVVDMHAPGVEVRPLRQMTGGASFNEVFFTDVRVPDSHLLGDVNGGWTVALTTLMNERAAIGGGGGGLSLPGHLYFVSPGQINVQVPWEFQGQTSVSMKVSVTGNESYLQSSVYPVPLATYCPDFFERSGIVAAVDFNSGTVVSATAPVARGDVVELEIDRIGILRSPVI